jgi:hypothetical protein
MPVLRPNLIEVRPQIHLVDQQHPGAGLIVGLWFAYCIVWMQNLVELGQHHIEFRRCGIDEIPCLPLQHVLDEGGQIGYGRTGVVRVVNGSDKALLHRSHIPVNIGLGSQQGRRGHYHADRLGVS